jgi:cobalt/nickel transport system permease protein
MTLGVSEFPTPDSAISRRDARWRLAALAMVAIVAVCLQTWPAALALCGVIVLLAVTARIPRRWMLPRLGVVVPFIGLFVAWLVWFGPDPAWTWGVLRISQHGLSAALLVFFKGTALLMVALIGMATGPLPETLAAAHRLRVPGVLIQITLLAYRYVLLFVQELRRVRIALRTRGYRSRPGLHSYRTVGNVAGTMLVRSYERAERVGQAMRCRGFDGRFRSLTTFGTSGADVAFFMVIVAVALGLGAWDWVQR